MGSLRRPSNFSLVIFLGDCAKIFSARHDNIKTRFAPGIPRHSADSTGSQMSAKKRLKATIRRRVSWTENWGIFLTCLRAKSTTRESLHAQWVEEPREKCLVPGKWSLILISPINSWENYHLTQFFSWLSCERTTVIDFSLEWSGGIIPATWSLNESDHRCVLLPIEPLANLIVIQWIKWDNHWGRFMIAALILLCNSICVSTTHDQSDSIGAIARKVSRKVVLFSSFFQNNFLSKIFNEKSWVSWKVWNIILWILQVTDHRVIFKKINFEQWKCFEDLHNVENGKFIYL